MRMERSDSQWQDGAELGSSGGKKRGPAIPCEFRSSSSNWSPLIGCFSASTNHNERRYRKTGGRSVGLEGNETTHYKEAFSPTIFTLDSLSLPEVRSLL